MNFQGLKALFFFWRSSQDRQNFTFHTILYMGRENKECLVHNKSFLFFVCPTKYNKGSSALLYYKNIVFVVLLPGSLQHSEHFQLCIRLQAISTLAE
jgi:hypothetical protein